MNQYHESDDLLDKLGVWRAQHPDFVNEGVRCPHASTLWAFALYGATFVAVGTVGTSVYCSTRSMPIASR